jgi:hypothetical protein
MAVSGQVWRRWAILSQSPSRLPPWLAVGVMGLVLLLLLMPLTWPWDGRLLKALENASHVPLYLVASLAGLTLLRPRITWSNLRKLLAAGVGLSIAVELLQALTGRDPDLGDAVYSVLGSWAAVLLWFSTHTARRVLILGAWALCGLVLLPVALPPAFILADRAHARFSFPLLASFEGRSEVGRWWSHGVRLTRVPNQATHARNALRVSVLRGKSSYPGLFMADGVRDWRGYRQLCFDLYLTGGSERALWVRADDRLGNPPYAERAQTQVNLLPGANSICLDLDSFLRTPDGRALDPSQIVLWGLFLDAPKGGESFFLDHVRLTR